MIPFFISESLQIYSAIHGSFLRLSKRDEKARVFYFNKCHEGKI
jgi:hypothetical protein